MDQSATDKPDIHRLLELQKLLISFGNIERRVFIPPAAELAESNVEHSFSLAMLAWFLAPHFPNLDANKIVYMCLAHDLLEVFCGDSFSFDEQAIKDQVEREAAAIVRLKHDWQDFPAMLKAIEEYEERQTDESKFVTALDRLHPILMDYLCEGRSWHKLGITFEKFLAVKDGKMSISPEVAGYYYQLKEILVQEPHLFPTK
jgi:putative hydrolases of HD superfamily